MNHKPYSRRLLAGLAAIMFAAVACGSTSAPAATSKGNITIAGFAFSEGSVLAELYGQALQHDGYKVTFKLNLGSREVVAPAIQSGQVDVYIGYARSPRPPSRSTAWPSFQTSSRLRASSSWAPVPSARRGLTACRA